jgi:hypothetical protein
VNLVDLSEDQYQCLDDKLCVIREGYHEEAVHILPLESQAPHVDTSAYLDHQHKKS